MPAPEFQRARPGKLRSLTLMGVGSLLVHEAVLGVIAKDLGGLASALQRGFETVDRLGRAPIIVIGEMRLERRADVGRLGDVPGRKSVEANRGREFWDADGPQDGDRTSHAKPGQSD